MKIECSRTLCAGQTADNANVMEPKTAINDFTQQAVDVSLGDGHVEVPEHLCLPGAPAVTLVDPGHLYGHVISCHHEQYYQNLS